MARDHGSHTNDPNTCRWATVARRACHRRTATHPRIPRKKASDDPTARMRGAPEGQELGAADEDAALRQPSGEPVGANCSAGSGSASSGSASSGEPARATRGPDTVARERRTWNESASGPATTDDWTSFDAGKSMKALRACDEPARRRILRKLHIRWWHATAAQMKRLLQQAGQPAEVLDLIDPIVDT